MSDMAISHWEFNVPDRTLPKPSVFGEAKQSKSEQPDRSFTESSAVGKTKEPELDSPSTSELPSNFLDTDVEMEVETDEHVFKKPLFKYVVNKLVTVVSLDPRTEGCSRPSPRVLPELEETDGMLTTVQPTEVYIVSHEDEDAKEVHLRSEDNIEEKLANRMDKCEI